MDTKSPERPAMASVIFLAVYTELFFYDITKTDAHV